MPSGHAYIPCPCGPHMGSTLLQSTKATTQPQKHQILIILLSAILGFHVKEMYYGTELRMFLGFSFV